MRLGDPSVPGSRPHAGGLGEESYRGMFHQNLMTYAEGAWGRGEGGWGRR